MTYDARRLAWAYLSRVAQGPHRTVTDHAAAHGPEATAAAVRAGRLGERLAARAHVDTAAADLDHMAALGGRLITPDDHEWPAWRFLGFDGSGLTAGVDTSPPIALWALGNRSVGADTERSVSIVGTRASSPYGDHVTAEISADLALDGWTVVSGAAFGIDAAAHRAALGVEGTTMAVLACGVDRAYPAGHSRLLRQIASSGVVLSEYAPGTTPAKHRFLARNRLVAALGSAVVVVEAGWRSGARNTAAWAAKLGRPVLAVPGPVTSPTSKGCHRMIREGEAVLVSSSHDVVAEAGALGSPEEPRPDLFREIDALSETALLIYDALPATGALSTRELSESSGVPLSKVRAALPVMEMDGFVSNDETGWARVVRG
ncbi:putative DNA processing protein DprA [Rhodococcus sp. NKCM2511]|uniref:DNA-processing protein DprA n=1 Tax=Rhodococcus sp. NKCM2511 TaxID=2766011 RepID=UPI0019107540|nr:DNA-processing protein DprA [Rhodococcus sp. NKCM2511]GHP15820.1 putative DNA processing protein DprA [Rhodococcus sp. NKCM2511]